MKAIASIDMNEVARLTRAGRVHDATALLQAGLSDGRPPRSAGHQSASQRLRLAMPDVGVASPDRVSPTPTHVRPLEALSLRCIPKAYAFKSGDRVRPMQSPDGASFAIHTIANADGTLAYKLYVPAHRTTALKPLVVMLHGCTQDPDDFAAGTRMNELAETYGFLVAYPIQTQAANSSRCWNWFRSGDQGRGRGEPSLIADATLQILSEHAVDPMRVFVAGLSAGGAAAAIMGCAYPDIFAGVGVHSGLACGAASTLQSAFAAMRGGSASSADQPSSRVPTIIFHGTADRTVNPENATKVTEQVTASKEPDFKETGATPNGVRYTKTIWRRTDGGSLVEQWMVDGAGHAWFGGSSEGSYTDQRGPDASREMLRFFEMMTDGEVSKS